jgi:hypothetical protein
MASDTCLVLIDQRVIVDLDGERLKRRLAVGRMIQHAIDEQRDLVRRVGRWHIHICTAATRVRGR